VPWRVLQCPSPHVLHEIVGISTNQGTSQALKERLVLEELLGQTGIRGLHGLLGD
jgi:hypothetical protein